MCRIPCGVMIPIFGGDSTRNGSDERTISSLTCAESRVTRTRNRSLWSLASSAGRGREEETGGSGHPVFTDAWRLATAASLERGRHGSRWYHHNERAPPSSAGGALCKQGKRRAEGDPRESTLASGAPTASWQQYPDTMCVVGRVGCALREGAKSAQRSRRSARRAAGTWI